MADLFVDGGALERMRADLLRIQELLERPGRELTHLEPGSVGGRHLTARLTDFADEWSYGIGKLSGLSRDAAEALTQVQARFREVDDALTTALRAEPR